VQQLTGILVVDFTRYLPGAYASRELLRLGARVVCVEAPDGDPLRETAPTWDAVLRSGKESVVCDLPGESAFARRLCDQADVVLEGFRPGVATRLGIGPDHVPTTTVYCSITGFGEGTRHEGRAGHDLNYLGWAGALADTAPALPPIQVADLAAGGLAAANRVLAALFQRERTGSGARIVISMTHGAHDLVAHRRLGDPRPRLLTGGLACYRSYPTADGRLLTVAALEPKFFVRLCELLGRPELGARQHDEDQETLAGELEIVFAAHSLEHWLMRFDDEDVCIGPVGTIAEAAAEFGSSEEASEVPLGADTEAWRRELRV
jgi:alpha-methylacyl-CoA racemase